ncbi:MAG: Multi-sensor signal transduction histidine kinase [candidate division WWE3 bacterium GW2011_GWA1_46_21]|uniref:histidine kinase n=4 Tax=Katanobacteria TaxID=422282 RepID=A0A0G1PDD8_UNCKA|nr:MAG: Multi-sensor signal transduction histidine kinase [candidate division WWE3 bacterium GW2011_GWA1_46_21]KKU48398.1 MAG: Multi-sensor signal transduction histidine kinase [candidate division WWE3 bacterium GW2011_GWA2_46_9]KKU50940.1 MAG: Multi-sensor signal transduction histidine kinase [candidate division WWE3 bacterium GW2011_GWC1_47_10]KKU57446.1 MAG: Multi-sensor signal transduction histidine kinase [candidate division WWE3 bacterium GW2011_GWB1_47_11]
MSIDDKKPSSDFIAMVVHELRSPLTVISGTADLLIKKSDVIDKNQTDVLLLQIKSSSDSLLKIVNDLLDAAKIDAGKFEISRSTNDINKLLQEESRYYTELARAKSITLKLDLNTNIQPFVFDYARITQVMNNLLSNAIKFTGSGAVIIRSDVQGTDVVVSVSDSGVGISDGDKSMIFDKFVQAASVATNNEKGTGLGLVISKGIISAHGGKIWVEDNTPCGSKFVFKLPLK